MLGFKVDPDEDKLKEVYHELSSIHRVFASKPSFGISFNVESKPDTLQNLKVSRVEDAVEIVDVDDGIESLAALYNTNGPTNSDVEPVYNRDLGLAMEALSDGYTAGNLWRLF